MRSIYIRVVMTLLMFYIAFPSLCRGETRCQSPYVKDDPVIPFKHLSLVVPDAWIENIANIDDASEPLPIIETFEQLLGKDSLGERTGEGYLNRLFVNLDDDPQNELLLIIGWLYNETKFCVFKQIDGKWRLLYLEDVHEHYQEPSFSVASARSPFKIFYLHQLYERGTGVYKDQYHFFKLINSKVHPCLRVIGKAHLVSWPTLLGEIVTASISVSGDDAIEVTYQYRFFPDRELFSLAYKKIGENILQGHPFADEELPQEDFIRAEETAFYQWNNETSQYELSWHQDDEFTPCKIARFGDFNNDALFLEAYGKDLETARTEWTPAQQFLLDVYLNEVKQQATRSSDLP